MKCANETRAFQDTTYDTLYGMRFGRAALAIAIGCATVTACLFPSLDDLEGGNAAADSSLSSDGPTRTDGGAEGSPTDGPAPDTSSMLSDLDCDAAVAVWPFDEGEGGTVSDCEGRYTGSLDNGCSWTTGPDGGGHAVAFDGGLITFPNTATGLRVGGSDEMMSSFTATAHVHSAAPTTGLIKFIMGRLTASNAWGIGLYYADALHATLGVRYYSQDISAYDEKKSAPFLLSDTPRWIHLAVSYEVTSSTFTFYIEGNSPSTAIMAAGDWKPANPDFEIGGISGNPSQGLYGAIRDVRLYNRALPASDIATIMAEK